MEPLRASATVMLCTSSVRPIAGAPDEYKALLVSESSTDLIYTGGVAGVPANWLTASIRR